MRDPQITGYAPHKTAGVTPDDVLLVLTRTPACDGGALGHPRIWLRMEQDEVVCPYCSRTYRLAPGTQEDDHH